MTYSMNSHLIQLGLVPTFGGFPSHGGTPIAGWFIIENPNANGWFGGTTIDGTPQIPPTAPKGSLSTSSKGMGRPKEEFLLSSTYPVARGWVPTSKQSTPKKKSAATDVGSRQLTLANALSMVPMVTASLEEDWLPKIHWVTSIRNGDWKYHGFTKVGCTSTMFD